MHHRWSSLVSVSVLVCLVALTGCGGSKAPESAFEAYGGYKTSRSTPVPALRFIKPDPDQPPYGPNAEVQCLIEFDCEETSLIPTIVKVALFDGDVQRAEAEPKLIDSESGKVRLEARFNAPQQPGIYEVAVIGMNYFVPPEPGEFVPPEEVVRETTKISVR